MWAVLGYMTALGGDNGAMESACESCGRDALETHRAALDDFLASATDIQRFQIANRLGLTSERIDDARLCADCAAEAVQWANVD